MFNAIIAHEVFIATFKVIAFCLNARYQKTSTPVNCVVDNKLFTITRHFWQTV